MNLPIPIAYLDPGTGSIIVQAVVGGVLGGLLIIKIYWKKIVSFFKGGKAPSATTTRPDQTPPSA